MTSCAFHSFLVEVQTKLATCLPCLRDSNVDNRIAGCSCGLQSFLSIVFVFMFLVHVATKKISSVQRKNLVCMLTFQVTKMSANDGKELLESWLKASNRSLTASQMLEVLDAFNECPYPPFLKVCKSPATYRNYFIIFKLSGIKRETILSKFLKTVTYK